MNENIEENKKEKMPWWVDDPGMLTLDSFRDYQAARKEEIFKTLSVDGIGGSFDNYMQGLARGLEIGLMISEDLVSAYEELMKQGSFFPDRRRWEKEVEIRLPL